MKSLTKVKVIVSILLVAILAVVTCFIVFRSNLKVDTYVASENLMAGDAPEQATINVKYVDLDGNSLETTTITGNVGDWYETSRKKFDGFVASGDEPLNKKGYITSGGDEVEFVYEKANYLTSSVDSNNQVNIGINNQKIRSEVDFKILATVTSDKEGTTNLPSAEFEITSNSKVIKHDKTIDNGELFIGTLTVRNEEEVSYIIEEKSVEGEIVRKLKSPFEVKVIKTWNSAEGKFEVSLDYDNTVQGVKVSFENGIIIVTVEHEKVTGKYTMEIVTTDENTGDRIDGSTFKVTKEDSSYSKEVTTENNGSADVDNFEMDESTKKVEVYYIEQIKAANDYDIVVAKPFRLQVTKLFQDEKYTVELDYDRTVAYVEVEIDDNNEIVIFVSAAKDEPCDYAIQYFATMLDIDSLDRAPTVKVNESGDISFEGAKDDIFVANNQRAYLDVRVYNNNKSKMLGKKVKLDIPSGLVFVPNNDININNKWKMYKYNDNNIMVETDNCEEATLLVSDALASIRTEGFDASKGETPKFETLQVVFDVNEKVISKDRKIVASAEVISPSNDINENNNKDTELFYVKYFDLNVEKKIENVKIITNGVEETKSYDANKDELVKVDIASSKLESTTLSIEYGIKVSNIGEIAGYAFEVTDYLPDGLVFNQEKNPDWYLDGNKLVSTALNARRLEPGDTAELKIILDWKLGKNSIGEKVNKAKITTYYNEYDATDVTDSNDDDEKIIVTVKTGAVTYAGICLIVLVVVTLIVVFVKKNSVNGGEKHAK